MTGTTINDTQYEAILHMFKSGDKHDIEEAHRIALQNGGWAKPGHDLSVLNTISDKDMQTGLNEGWNIVSDQQLPLTTDDARQTAAMNVAKNSIYGDHTAPKQANKPKPITLTFEQDAALYHVLHLLEGRKEVMRILHGAMLATGGWTWPDCAALNSLTLADMDTVLSGTYTTASKQPFRLKHHPNGAELTKTQIDAINGWFLKPGNVGKTPDDFISIERVGPWGGTMHPLNSIPSQTLGIALFIGVKTN